jgi:hypothetical protein
MLQLKLDLVCDCDFSPNHTDTVVVIGKEHLGWWSINLEEKSVTLTQTADYQAE